MTGSTSRLHRAHPRASRARLGVHLAMAPAGGGALPADAPTLTPREPESTRAAVISGGITTFIHLLGIGALALLAWLAPEVAEIIPVKIIQELPGSNDPAPAPRKVIARRPVPQVTAAQLQQTVKPAAVTAQQVSAQRLDMAAVDPVTAPTQIQRKQVTAERVTALTSTSGPRLSAQQLGQIEAVDVRPTDLVAPTIDATGPRVVTSGVAVAEAAPQVAQAFEGAGGVEYVAQASPGEYTEGPVNTIIIDTGVSDQFAGGTGGTGTAENTVDCLNSAYSQRYLALIADRTKKRWVVPDGTAAGEQVVLSFELDASGTATNVTYVGKGKEELGASAAAAFRAASPFPPMADANRCLASHKLRATFSVPAE